MYWRWLRVENRVMFTVDALTAQVECLLHIWWTEFVRRDDWRVKVNCSEFLRTLDQAVGGLIKLIETLDWVHWSVKGQHWLRLRKSWQFGWFVCCEGDSTESKPSNFWLSPHLVHFNVEWVFRVLVHAWPVEVEKTGLLHRVLMCDLFLLHLAAVLWTADFFKHVALFLQTDLVRYSLDLSLGILSMLSWNVLLIFRNGALNRCIHLLTLLFLCVRCEPICWRRPCTSPWWINALLLNCLLVFSHCVTDFVVSEQVLLLYAGQLLDRFDIHGGYFNVRYHVAIKGGHVHRDIELAAFHILI